MNALDNYFLVCFFFLGDGILITVTFSLPLSLSVMAGFHFSPTLKSQQEGQQLVAWEV